MRTKKYTAFYALNQIAFWMEFCLSSSFAAVYLGAIGYSNTELGILLAIGNILGLVLGTILSDLIDRREHISAGFLLWFLLAAQAVSFLVLRFVPQQGIVTSTVYPLLLMLSLSVNTLNLKLCADFEHMEASINFGVARSLGSAAYAALSMVLGIWIARRGAPVLLTVGLAVTALQFVANGLLTEALAALRRTHPRTVSTVPAGRPLGEFLRENPRFCRLLCGMALIFFSHNTSSTFLINIVRHAGGDTGSLGYLNAFIAGVEMPAMLLYSVYGKRKSRSAALRLSFIFFTLKAAALAAAPSVPLLFAAESLQTLSYAIFAPAIVAYVSLVIPYEDSAKGQSLANSMSSLGGVLASLLSGWLFDTFTVPATLGISALVCAVGTYLSCRGMEHTKRS